MAAVQPRLEVKFRVGAGSPKTAYDAEAYALLTQLARLYTAEGRELKLRPGQAVSANVKGGIVASYSTNMFVNATPATGLKIHVKPGDCGCAFKRFAR